MRETRKMKLINKISGSIKNSNKPVNIPLEGKNLIIAGGNGSGKTSLAMEIFQSIHTQIIGNNLNSIPIYENNIIKCEEALKDPATSETERLQHQQDLRNIKMALTTIQGPTKLEYNNPAKILGLYHQKQATIRFFAADRKAMINSVHAATASQPEAQSIEVVSAQGQNLEQHLVNLKVRSALAMQAGELGKHPSHAEEWIASFTKNLKYLFEDDSTELKFNPEKLNFLISQSGKPLYSFQSLSSGYLAIFDIYANLLMHTEYAQIHPTELAGVVVIDEIDAHLHVSLQRKILPFFTNSFPSIQFIVTTHSPFVLTSVDNAVIYDITTNQVASDLSMFSYESIVEGLLGVPPISKKFEDTIKELTKITSASSFDYLIAEKLLSTITPYVDVLDAESQMFYQIAANKIIKSKAESK
jgi:AAA15 family ATPase/GTPase